MTDPLDVDICVIGAGAGGLSVAAGAAMMGARVALAEKGAMGGDCLNYGCVPSKALLAAGKAARAAAGNPALGVPGAPPTIDSPAVYGHVRGVIDAIAPLDSVERFEGLGVTVIQGAARFLGPDRVAVGDRTVTARRFVVATGSSPLVPPIPGLDTVPYLTNETLFDRQALPGHLIILGGGPIGVEMAQAHRNLGCAVTVVEMFSILPKDDPELADVVRRRLVADGVTLREGLRVVRVAADGDGVALFAKGEGDEERLTGTHLLVAAGRAPNVAGLDLDAAGIDHSPRGIAVDAGLKTSNR
ncbi:MAG: FAD-dependent oxidoreductase, partial [Rhodobacterales bacterium]|nr:FAD-dependent oxidoreductase [Rhodobacterales bacterium]